MARHALHDRLLITDGGLATALEAAGHDTSGPLWSGRVLVEAPGAVSNTHAAFVRAGADVVITASYQVTVPELVRWGLEPARAREVLAGTVALARDAAAVAGRDVRVAASSGTWSALQRTGAEYRPMPTSTTVEQLVDFHLERARLLAGAAPDVLLFETLSGVREVRAAAAVADQLAHRTWVTVNTPDGHHTTDGDPITEVGRLVEASTHVEAVGINCSAPGTVLPALARLGATTDRRLVARPNAGATWRDGAWREPLQRTAMTDLPLAWWDAGASIIGGCCGTGPEDIAAIRGRLSPRW